MTFFRDKVFWLFVSIGFVALFTLSLIKTNYNFFWYKDYPLQFFNLVIVSAVMEELIFRGVLFSLLQKKISTKLTIITTSILFSLSHLYMHSPVWAALVFFPGILFGILRARHLSPVSAIALHFIYNLMYFSLYEF